MINVDKREIESILKQNPDSSSLTYEDLHKIMFHTSRMLLVTRGLDATSEDQIFSLFGKHFVQTELIDIKFLPLVDAAKNKNQSYLLANKEAVTEVSEAIRELYKTMDDSLRFKVKAEAKQPQVSKTSEVKTAVATIEKDFRGVGCPMNFVKTKLVLETMTTGQQLSILLDDGAPIQNVPNSVKLEGHKVLSQNQSGEGHWTVLIEKG